MHALINRQTWNGFKKKQQTCTDKNWQNQSESSDMFINIMTDICSPFHRLRTLTLHPWLTFGNRDGFIAPEAKFSVAQSELHTQAPTQSSWSKKLSVELALQVLQLKGAELSGGLVWCSSLNYPENDVWAIAVRTNFAGDDGWIH